MAFKSVGQTSALCGLGGAAEGSECSRSPPLDHWIYFSYKFGSRTSMILVDPSYWGKLKKRTVCKLTKIRAWFYGSGVSLLHFGFRFSSPLASTFVILSSFIQG